MQLWRAEGGSDLSELEGWNINPEKCINQIDPNLIMSNECIFFLGYENQINTAKGVWDLEGLEWKLT